MRYVLLLVMGLSLAGCPKKTYPYEACMVLNAYSKTGGQPTARMFTVPVTNVQKGVYQPKLCDSNTLCGTFFGEITRDIGESPLCWGWEQHQRVSSDPAWEASPEMENLMKYVKDSGQCVKVCEITVIKSAWLSEPATTTNHTNKPVMGEPRQWGCDAGACTCNGVAR